LKQLFTLANLDGLSLAWVGLQTFISEIIFHKNLKLLYQR
jgi:hypothetical protein